MAKHDFDLDKWIDDLGLSAEDRALVSTKLAPAADKIKEGQLRQSDYTAKIQQAVAAKAEADRLAKESEDYAASLATWKSEQEKIVGGDVADVAKVKGENAALKAYLERTGVDITSLGLKLDTEPTKVETKVEPSFDPSKVVSLQQGLALAKWPIVFRNLDAEHLRLYGKPMSDSDANTFLDKVMKEGRDPNVIFNEQFKVEERKAAIQLEQQEQWKAQTKKELETQIRSEIMSQKHIPNAGINGNSTVIETFGVLGKTNSDRSWNDSAVADYTRRLAAREGNVQ
jgi:hypothetical protein